MTSDTYHHGDLQAALLRSVGELVLERGVDGVTLREAARRSGVSHSAPAHHFGDKQGMLRAFATEGFHLLDMQMRTSFEGVHDAPLQPRLRALGEAYLRFAIDHPAHYEVMFRTMKGTIDFEADDDLHGTAERTMMPLALLVNEMGATGVIDPDKGLYAATMLWSVVHGLASLWIDGAIPHMYETETADSMIEGVLDTLTELVFRP